MTATTSDRPPQALHVAIERLAQIQSGLAGGGITREIYTPEYTRANEFVSGLMMGAGLDVRLDSVGNLFGRWTGSDPAAPRVLTGSHFDTTLNAGKYDGVLGVLGAIEAIHTLRARGYKPRRSIEVVGFAGEEPRFGAGCIGSRAMVGQLTRADLDRMHDREGVTVAQAMRSANFDPDRVGEAELNAADVFVLVELHIEQGAVLETEGIPIGVVEHIAAPHDLRVTVTGLARHSGSTPMGLRRDALTGASEIVLEVERLARASRSSTTVGTVGVLQVSPGAVNVIPGEVRLDIDIRDSDLETRTEVIDAVLAFVDAVAKRRELTVEISTIARDVPAACDERVVDAVREACLELQLPYRGIISGAYHDSMVLGAKVPMGMIFVPSVGGLSHHPDEFTEPIDLDRGVAVLAGALARLAA